jgi:hypothetical protein
MDPLPFVRNHMISYISDLLREKPEQEQLLLRLLVNKLVRVLLHVGDADRRVTHQRKSPRKHPTSSYNSNPHILK